MSQTVSKSTVLIRRQIERQIEGGHALGAWVLPRRQNVHFSAKLSSQSAIHVHTDFGIFVSAVDELVVACFCCRLFQASSLDVDRATITMKFHKFHGSFNYIGTFNQEFTYVCFGRLEKASLTYAFAWLWTSSTIVIYKKSSSCN